MSTDLVVPEGYKQTEVGVIPEDWDVGHLDEFWSVTDCKHITAKFVSSGYPVASIQEVQSKYVNLTHAKQTTYDFYKVLSDGRRKLESGDLILSRNATVGEVAQVMDWHPTFAMGQDVCLLRRKSPAYSPDYLQGLFEFASIKKQLDDCMVGTTFKRINVRQVKSLIIQMPPPKEQATIASALSDVDALITSLEMLIAKKRAIKIAAMQQLLTGKKRLPPFDQGHVGYKQTELGEVPEDWDISTLGNFCDLVNGRGFKPYEWSEHGLPIIRIQNLNGSDNFNFYDGHYDPKIFVQSGQLLFAWSGSRGTSFGPHTWYGQDALLNYHTWKVVINEAKVDSDYFYHALKVLTKSIEDSAHGASALVHTQKGEMEKFSISLPKDKEEQAAIAEVLTDMDKEIQFLEQRLSKTHQLKQGMMQELLTGKTRLI